MAAHNSVNDDYCLLSMFENVVCNEHKIKLILSDKMSSYKEKAEFAPL